MRTGKYRVFPILMLAFFRVATLVAVGLAFPLYFIDEGLNPEIIGIITSGTSMAYLVSPLIFRNVHKKIGMKKAIIISTGGFLFTQIVYQISLNPYLVYSMLILDGIVLGLFWPVLMTSVSAVSSLENYRGNNSKKDKLMKNYSISWNLGGILSYVLSTIVLFIVSDIILIFRLSLLFCIIIFIAAFIYKEPKNNFEEEIIVPIDERIKAFPQREQINFPLFLPLFITAIYGFLISSIGLAYPIKSETLNFELYTNYMFFFFRMSTQTISISITMDFSIRKLKKIIPWTTLITFLSIFFMGINQDLVVFGVLFCLFGIFVSFMYTLAFKLILFRNIANNTSKYSVYFETLMGVGFFLAPIVSGFIAAWNVDFSFYFSSILTVITLFIILLLGKKVRE